MYSSHSKCLSLVCSLPFIAAHTHLSGCRLWLDLGLDQFLSGLATGRFTKIQKFCPDGDQTFVGINGGPDTGDQEILNIHIWIEIGKIFVLARALSLHCPDNFIIL